MQASFLGCFRRKKDVERESDLIIDCILAKQQTQSWYESSPSISIFLPTRRQLPPYPCTLISHHHEDIAKPQPTLCSMCTREALLSKGPASQMMPLVSQVPVSSTLWMQIVQVQPLEPPGDGCRGETLSLFKTFPTQRRHTDVLQTQPCSVVRAVVLSFIQQPKTIQKKC